MSDEHAKIYVACLASYNDGKLYGKWIDLDGKDADDIHAEIADMLKASPMPHAEEWAIHDYELPHGVKISENPDLDALVELVKTLEKHGVAYAIYRDMVGDHYATEDGFDEAFEGEYHSKEEWAEQYAESTGMLDSVPADLRCYFDLEKYAHDCEVGGDMHFVEHDGSVYAFRNC